MSNIDRNKVMNFDEVTLAFVETTNICMHGAAGQIDPVLPEIGVRL